MNRIVTAALIALTAFIAGCSSQPEHVEQAYSDAQIKQFALEMLSRSGLSYEEYEKLRRAIENPARRMSQSSRALEALTNSPGPNKSRILRVKHAVYQGDA